MREFASDQAKSEIPYQGYSGVEVEGNPLLCYKKIKE
jgi:hypothetical protein